LILIDFVLSCRLPELPQFLFLSPIAAVSRLEDLLPVLEHAIPATVAVRSGYGESKWVAEALLTGAIARTPLHVVMVRGRQVSGNLDEYWNSSDWFPSMILYASSVKRLPLTSTEMVSTYHSYGTVPRSISHLATHSHHPAVDIFYTLGCFLQGDRQHAKFSNPNSSPLSPIAHTMELRHPTDSRHTLCPRWSITVAGSPT